MNKESIIKHTLCYVGSVYGLWGFVSLFNPLDGLIDNNLVWYYKLLVGFGALVGITLICFVLSCAIELHNNKSVVLTSNTEKKVIVQFGDIFSPKSVVDNYNGRINLVVPVNRCFDTKVDDDLISHSTLHGKVMQKLYDAGLFTESSLNESLQQSLQSDKPEKKLEVADKSSGNLDRYPCGTVAEIKIDEKKTFFFLGLSKFDSKLKASTTKAEFVLAVQKLIEFCNSRSQGYPVILPLFGSGLSRTNISQTEILSYLVSAFKVNRDIINCDFHIVVFDGMKDKISISDL